MITTHFGRPDPVSRRASVGNLSQQKKLLSDPDSAHGCERGISKSEVSRICQNLDTQLRAFLHRPLEFSYFSYLYLYLTYLYGRDQACKQVDL